MWLILFAGTCSIMIIGCVVVPFVGNFIPELTTKKNTFLRNLKRKFRIARWRIALALLIYTFMLCVMIWATIEANTNPGGYEAFIIKKGHFSTIAGIIIGIGFLPVILMILVFALATLIVSFGIVFWVGLFLLLGFLKFCCCSCPYSERFYDALEKFMGF